MRRRTILLSCALLLAGAAGVSAQAVPWETPMLLPPGGRQGAGIYLADMPGSDIAVIGMLRTGRAPYILGLRGGVADTNRGASIFGGADFSGQLVRDNPEFPLDLWWVLGAGLSYGEILVAPGEEDGYFLLTIPLGVTLGKRFDAEGLTFLPYATPRLLLDGAFGIENVDSDIELDFAVDLGVDFGLRPGWVIRFGATVGDDRDALAIGLAF